MGETEGENDPECLFKELSGSWSGVGECIQQPKYTEKMVPSKKNMEGHYRGTKKNHFVFTQMNDKRFKKKVMRVLVSQPRNKETEIQVQKLKTKVIELQKTCVKRI